MAAEKHPVSFLQEMMAQQHKAPPNYHITSSHSGFVCDVTVDGITASATASAKQAAKFQAATIAAAKLKQQPRMSPKASIPAFRSDKSRDETAHTSDSSLPEITSDSCINDSTTTEQSPSSNTLVLGQVPSAPQAIFKHPISELQEMMVKRKELPPNYIVTDTSTPNYPSFHCSLTIQGETFVSAGSSKQITRKETAEKALEYLKHRCPETKIAEPVPATTNAVEFNAIGFLNEHLQKKGRSTATYQEMGLNDKNEFVIMCSAMGKCTDGTATNKKLAKKEAALNMITLLNANSGMKMAVPHIIPRNTNDDENDDEKVLEKYAVFSENISQANQFNVNPRKENINERYVDLLIERGKSLSIKEVVPERKADLIKYLADLNVPYTCTMLQDDPFIISLNFDDGTATSALGTGETYEMAYIAVLKQAFKMKYC